MWDPQRYLDEHHPDVKVVDWELPPPLMGCCDHKKRTIWLAAGLDPVRRRCVLALEIAQLEKGPTPDDPCLAWARQKEAEEWAAKMLVPPDVFVAAWACGCLDLPAMAEWCGVDLRTFRTRTRAATDAEQDEVVAVIGQTRLSA